MEETLEVRMKTVSTCIAPCPCCFNDKLAIKKHYTNEGAWSSWFYGYYLECTDCGFSSNAVYARCGSSYEEDKFKAILKWNETSEKICEKRKNRLGKVGVIVE